MVTNLASTVPHNLPPCQITEGSSDDDGMALMSAADLASSVSSSLTSAASSGELERMIKSTASSTRNSVLRSVTVGTVTTSTFVSQPPALGTEELDGSSSIVAENPKTKPQSIWTNQMMLIFVCGGIVITILCGVVAVLLVRLLKARSPEAYRPTAGFGHEPYEPPEGYATMGGNITTAVPISMSVEMTDLHTKSDAVSL